MTKSAGRKKRLKEERRAQVRAVPVREARRAPRSRAGTWSAGKVTVWTIVAVAAFIGLVPAF
ncbi:hypothetical protein [Umezawaea sp. Da 62-37]|uniref:hypothetical protein n=1 Tax=Umezawaea sp. Da 62-37 TaxID=3075927 RepID=UPI0028F6D782|nr:hypothetical protein [Umezawaea sp. Da 62-37]WNV82778.1 hypothetical protein RM788_31865 [Umezawaea sp. Da 62-37]